MKLAELLSSERRFLFGRGKDISLGVLSTLLAILSSIAICYLLVWLLYNFFC